MKRALAVIMAVTVLVGTVNANVAVSYAAEDYSAESISGSLSEDDEDAAENIEADDSASEEQKAEAETDVENGDNEDNEESDNENVEELSENEEPVEETEGDVKLLQDSDHGQVRFSGTWTNGRTNSLGVTTSYSYELYPDGFLHITGEGDFVLQKDDSPAPPWTKTNADNQEEGFLSSVRTIKLDSENAEQIGNGILGSGITFVSKVDLSGSDLSRVTNMSGLFYYMDSLKEVIWPSSGTVKPTDISNMFYRTGMVEISLDDIDTSEVTNMNGCFSFSDVLKNVTFGDTKKAVDMTNLFRSCNNLISVEGLDTDAATSLFGLFWSCTKLETVDISEFNTENVDTMGRMFSDCTSLKSVTGINSLNTSSLCFTERMFENCTSLEEMDLNGFRGKFSNYNRLTFRSYDSDMYSTYSQYGVKQNYSEAGNFCYMFSGCTAIKKIDISGLDLSKIGRENTNAKDVGKGFIDNTPELKFLTIPAPNTVSVTISLGKQMASMAGTIYTEFPKTGNSPVTLYPPGDIPPEEFTGGNINFKGYAVAKVLLKDSNNRPLLENTRIFYYRSEIPGREPGEYLTTVDKDGYAYIYSDVYMYNVNGNNDKTFSTGIYYDHHYDENDPNNEADYGKFIKNIEIKNIHVSNLSFSQEWEGKVDIGATGSVGPKAEFSAGPAAVEASCASLSGTLERATSVDLKHTYKDGKRDLFLGQAYDVRAAAKVSAGPTAEITGNAPLTGEITLAAIEGQAGIGVAAKSGISISDYDPENNPEQLMDIGKYLIGCSALSGGNVFLIQVLAAIGYTPGANYSSSKIYVDSQAGIDTLKVAVSDKWKQIAEADAEAFCANYKGVVSSEYIRDKNSGNTVYTKKLAKSTKSELKAFDFDVYGSRKFLEWNPSAYTDAPSTTTSLSITGTGSVVAITDVSEVSMKLRYGNDDNNGYSVNVAYTGDEAKKIHDNIPKAKLACYPFCLNDFSSELLSYRDAKGNYTLTHDYMEAKEHPFNLGLSLGAGVKVETSLNTSYTESYALESGTFEYDANSGENTFKVNSVTDKVVAEYVDAEKLTPEEMMDEALKSIADLVATKIQTAAQKVAEGVENGYAKIKASASEAVKEWNAHIDKVFKDNYSGNGLYGAGSGPEEFTSYDIYSYSMYGAGEEEEKIVTTVGDSYNVYVTGDDGNVIADWEGNTLALELSYTEDMLTAAQASLTDASSLGIYRYSEEAVGYLYLGGTVDEENKTVTLDIDTPGQYILAIDKKAPVITTLSVSDDSSKPVIIAGFDEMSGFSQFSLKLDGKEIVNMDNFSDYYVPSALAVKYPVTKPLSRGEHELSVYAVDAAGNAMAEPKTVTFTVNVSDTPDGLWGETVPNPQSADEQYYYTGKAIKPDIRVYDRDKLLAAGKDYTVKYANNVKAYTLSEGDEGFFDKKGKTLAPCVTVTGKGNYSGKDIIYFKINPVSVDDESVYCDSSYVVTAGKKSQTPVPSIIWNGRTLKKGTEYTVSYYEKETYVSSDEPGEALSSVKDAGEYVARISGKGNFTGFVDVPLTLSKASDCKLVSKLNIKAENVAYTGEAVQPKLTVKDGKKILTVKNKEVGDNYDYEVNYLNNVAVGTAYAVIKGNPAKGYGGTRRVSFKITGTALSSYKFDGVFPKSRIFAEKEETIDSEVIAGTIKVVSKKGSDVLVPYDEKTKTGDFVLSYKNNAKAGTATVTATGVGGYTGKITKTFKIEKKSLKDADITVVRKSGAEVPYEKGGAKCDIEVSYGETILSEGKDYTLTYKNNGKAGLEASVTVKGKGNYKDAAATVVTYKVLQQDIAGLVVSASDKAFQSKKGNFATSIKITDLNGKPLSAGTDYDKKFTYTYDKDLKEAVDPKSTLQAGTTVWVTVKGKNSYTGTISQPFRIVAKDISTASISVPDQVYTGDEVTLSEDQVTVKVKGKVVPSVDPETGLDNWKIDQTTYLNNVKKGTASVTIRGYNNYGSLKKVNFKIKTRLFSWWKLF